MKNLMLLAATLLGACAPAALSSPPDIGQPRLMPAEFEELDTRITDLMAANDVKGMAIAIIDRDEIRHVRAFGYANVERRVPLETDSIMYAASITKAAFSYMVLQLVDEGMIGLDTPISEYLPKPLPEYTGDGRGDWSSLAGDERWRLLTPRILLNHSSGLANLRWLEPDQKMSFHFTPGTAYAYSGEGFYLLQFVLEKGLGLNVKDEMQRRIFDRFGMPNTSMQWREDFASHLADGYRFDGTFEPHDARSNVSASGSMDTTIADQARTIRIPVHMVETINKLLRVSRRLVQEYGREPTSEEIGEGMEVSPEKVREVLKISQLPVSLETPIGEEGDSHLGDFIEDRLAIAPSEAASQQLLKEQVLDVLHTLNDREARVLQLRFGLEDGRGRTLEEVGRQFGVTRERIRQIEAKALRKLRHPSRSRKLRDFLE